MSKRLIPIYTFLYPYEKLWVEVFGSDSILKPYRIVGLLVSFVFVLRLLTTKRRLKLDRYDLGFSAIIAGGLVLAGFWYLVAGTANLAWAVNETALLSFVFILSVVMKNEVDTAKAAEHALLGLVAGTLSSVLMSQGLGLEISSERAHGYLENPNALGVLAGLSFHILVARLIFGRHRNMWLQYAVTGLMCTSLAVILLITGSRTPLIALLASTPMFAIPLLMRRDDARRRALSRVAGLLPILVGVIVLIGMIYVSASDDSLFVRYSYQSAKGGSGRFDIWRSALRLSEDHYFLGVGAGQYRYHHMTYIRLLATLYSRGTDQITLGTHSDLMNLLTCYGLPLLATYLAMVFGMLRRMTRAIADGQHEGSYLLPALVACLSFVLVNQMGHNMMQGVDFFLIAGLASSPIIASRRGRESRRAHAHRTTGFERIDVPRTMG